MTPLYLVVYPPIPIMIFTYRGFVVLVIQVLLLAPLLLLLVVCQLVRLTLKTLTIQQHPISISAGQVLTLPEIVLQLS